MHHGALKDGKSDLEDRLLRLEKIQAELMQRFDDAKIEHVAEVKELRSVVQLQKESVASLEKRMHSKEESLAILEKQVQSQEELLSAQHAVVEDLSSTALRLQSTAASLEAKLQATVTELTRKKHQTVSVSVWSLREQGN